MSKAKLPIAALLNLSKLDLAVLVKDRLWSYQGFGMLRCYLDPQKRWRLNYWLPSIAVPNVSVIHDHPWSFTSYILRGQLMNIRYSMVPVEAPTPPASKRFAYHEIITGEGGGPVATPKDCRLIEIERTIYTQGDVYSQVLDEIHETSALEGTITLNDRSQPTQAHTARVFWPYGTSWVDAVPRAATAEELAMIH